MHKIQVDYDGAYPNLCSGTWVIKIDDKVVYSGHYRNFNTFNTYQSWHFDENWCEVFEDYEDGLAYSDWVQAWRLLF